MKVYVDKLPEDCLDCPCDSEYYCNLLNEDVGCCKWGERHKNCPLQFIADYTKQVRKEVCDEIREIADIDDWEEINGYTLDKILDQIQGKQNGKE